MTRPRTGTEGTELAAARRRLDLELVRRGLVASRNEGVCLVADGRVLVGGSVAEKPARLVSAADPIVVTGPPARFVSRGGEKLDAALEHFGIDVKGRTALDAGASTGGFTDCLLQRGAATVVAVDVGHGQLHPRLRGDPRVEVMERVNIRYLQPAHLGGRRFDVVTADLSFISLRTVASALTFLAGPCADLVVLVKPQFEAGRAVVSRGRGVVREQQVWREAINGAIGAFVVAGAKLVGEMASPLLGADGNQEFLLHLRPGG
ncbi:MAG: TlyA family RNA methyltransferase [Acidimicrobiales bacterium]